LSAPLRLGLLYAALFLGTGVSQPYLPVWFARQGLSGGEIGLILALPLTARIVTAPLLAVWADSFRLRRTPLAILGVLVAGCYALLAMPLGLAGWALAWFAAASMYTTLSPLIDVLTLRRAQRDGFNYGLPRSFGSAAYIVANLAAGALISSGSADIVPVWMIAAAACVSAAALAAPADPAHGEGAADPQPLSGRLAAAGDLLRDRAFMAAVLSIGLIQASHVFFYSFSALTWRRQGLGEEVTGALWAFGVAVEIAFLWRFEALRRCFGARGLLVAGGVAAVVRWIAFACSPPAWLLWPLMALHALTFAATFVGGLALVQRLSSPRNASAAQALSSALSGGVLSGLATLASGPLFDRYGAGGYLLCAVMAAAGLAGALLLYRSKRLDAA
jgi:MFS transporter, PPP family, 3-phenylpropionic acid transporter